MPHTSDTRYAVVSCHVERILADDVFARLLHFARDRPGGFPIAALIRPPDPDAAEDEAEWLERARQLIAIGPFGHHTHWTSPSHARPRPGDDAGARVLREATWFEERDLTPTLFCGGGWYTDAGVAAAVAASGYADCTPRARRPGYLPLGAPWAQLDAPARVETTGGVAAAIPTTHSIGDLARAVVRPGGLPEPVVHVYFHDTDLLEVRRRSVLIGALRLLGRRRRASDLDVVVANLGATLSSVPFGGIARGEGSDHPE